jgi:dUTP pyrophosphatase
MALQVEKLFPEANLPVQSTGASYDLIACTHGEIKSGHRQVVPLGIVVKFPEGFYGRVSARPGLTVKNGIILMSEIIEPDYTGELKIVLYNSDMFNSFIFHPGFKIAQLIVEQYVKPQIEEIPQVFYKVCGV